MEEDEKWFLDGGKEEGTERENEELMEKPETIRTKNRCIEVFVSCSSDGKNPKEMPW